MHSLPVVNVGLSNVYFSFLFFTPTAYLLLLSSPAYCPPAYLLLLSTCILTPAYLLQLEARVIQTSNVVFTDLQALTHPAGAFNNVHPMSEAFSAEISLRSPRTLFLCIIKKHIFWIKVSKKTFIFGKSFTASDT